MVEYLEGNSFFAAKQGEGRQERADNRGIQTGSVVMITSKHIADE